MAFGNDPGTGTAAQRRDAVMMYVGDTIATAMLLTDEIYDFLLLQAGDDLLSAAINAARSIAANFARQARVAHGPSSVDPTKRADHFFALADRLEGEVGLLASADAGGISIADKEATEDDTDRVRPAFRVGMDDNPSADLDERLC
jgi:hypothetical protein